jgi:transcriptional regulator with XRE-family HTH domain
MKLEEYRKELQQDPEYVAAEQELKPFFDLADDVLDLRLEKGWSQSELARRIGTRQANISRIESGLANPTLKFLQKLAQALDTELVIRLQPQQPVARPKVIYVPVKTALPWRERKNGEITWNVLNKTDIALWQR